MSNKNYILARVIFLKTICDNELRDLHLAPSSSLFFYSNTHDRKVVLIVLLVPAPKIKEDFQATHSLKRNCSHR